MECGTCHHDNETDAKFCGECGAPMAARCQACDARQPPGSKFCNQCGTPMSGAPPPAASAPAPPAAVRKQVTALFADLVGSTAFGERVDPEAARAALAPYFEILRATVEGHAGTVVKFTGDGVMAIFGIPEVAEDDAVRAVAAGLELQRRFRGFADTVRDRHALELGLRVGINTGELVIADGDADLVGDVLNTAARIEAACEPGRVTVGEDTWRLTRSNVSYEVLGEVTVKGKAEALATFQVVDDDRSAPEDATPFVGRAAELGALRSAFDDTVASGVAKLVTVVGAPGVGKTRLAAELRADIAVRSFDLRFERRGSTTFTPIVELLRELTRSGSPEDVALLVADHPEAARMAGVLSSFLGHGDARSTEESFWAVRRLLEHLAATEPLVIVVDDIQWAEALFWDLLDHLVEWAEAPVLLVALARPELRELRPELTQAGRRVSAAVSLEGLDADTTRELAARLLDTDELPRELVERIPASTEGNPLFVRELVQMLVDDGTLANDGVRWHLTIDADAIEVPPTVLSLLASRVERLPDDERQVVELASVIGTEFDRGLLAAIAGPEVSARLGALIDRLRRKDLVEPSGTWAGDHPVYRFHHVLVRDAAYRRLLKGHRADLHERVGRYVDQLGRNGDASDVVLAFHYEQVHRYRSELGTLDDDTRELARLAAGRLRLAADQALERDDLTASGSFAERALALTDDHEQRRELLLLGCEALLSSGDVTRGGALVDAMDRADQRDDRFDAWSDCFRAQLWSLTDADRLAESEALADHAADRLDALDDQSGVAKARLVRAACLARLGRVGDCEDELDLALGAARAAGDRRRTVAVLGAAPLAALWGPSPVARAGGRCLDVLRLLRITTASPAVEATSVRCQGMLEALRGRLDSARTKLEQSRATAREIGLGQGLFETELFAGLIELLDGDPVAAEPHLRAARNGLGRLGIGADAGQAAALLGRALLRQGRIDEADDLAGEALASAGQNLQTAMAARAVLAEVRSAQGRHNEASSLIAEAAGIAERTDVIVDHALVELAGVVVAEAAHDRAAAHRHRERARQLLDAKGVTLDLLGATTDSAVAPPSAVPASPTATRNRSDGSGRAADEVGVARRPENRATVASQRVFGMGRDGDRDGWFDAHHDDAEIVFHMSLTDSVFAHQTVDLATWAETTFGYPDDEVLTLSPVAVRGDDLCIGLLDIRAADRHRTAYILGQLDDGKIARVELFGEDQLWDAFDRLDELWLGPEMTVGARTGNYRAVASGDLTAILGFLADDFESVDRRRLGHDVRDREQYAACQLPPDHDPWIALPVETLRHEVRDEWVVELDRLSVSSDGSVVEMLKVFVARGRLLTRSDDFDVDDVEAAHRHVDDLLAELSDRPVDELTADMSPSTRAPGRPVALENGARRLALTLDCAFRDGDREAALALMHEEFVGDHRERLHTDATFDREQWADEMIHRHHLGEDVRHHGEVIAIRGDDYVLIRNTSSIDGDDISELLLLEAEDERLRRARFYDHDQIVDAQIDLDRRYYESIGFGPGTLLWDHCGAAYATDPAHVVAILHPDFELSDHRPIVRVRTDRRGLAYAYSFHESSDYVTRPRLLATTSRTYAYELTEHVGADYEIPYFIVVSVADDLVRRIDVYAAEADAMRRFAELEGDGGDARELRNSASDLLAETALLRTRVDVEAMRDRLHPNFVCRNLGRVFSSADDMDRDEWVELIGTVLDMGGRYESSVVAIRGDDLALSRMSFVVGDDVSERLVLCRLDDGLAIEVVVFDAGALTEAQIELDRRHLLSLGYGPGSDRWNLLPAANAVDAASIAPLLHPHFRFVDHRPAWWPAMDRDAYVEAMSTFDVADFAICPRILAITDRAGAFERVEHLAGGYQIQVYVAYRIEHGLVIAAEGFATEAEAMRRFEEFEAEGADSFELRNSASDIATALAALRSSADVEAQRDVLHPEFVGRVRGPLFVASHDPDRDAWIEFANSVFVGGRFQTSVVAIRGDDLALSLMRFVVGDDVSERLVLTRLDGELVREAVVFEADDLHDALDWLDRSDAELRGSSKFRDLLYRARHANLDGDRDAVRDLLASDFHIDDRRTLGIGDVGRDDYVRTSTRAGTTYLVREILDDTGRVALARSRWIALDGSHWDQLDVVTYGDGRFEHIVLFDPDDQQAARLLFNELVSARTTDAPKETELENEAAELGRRMHDLLMARDLEGLEGVIHRDFVGHSARRFRTMDSFSFDEFRQQWFAVYDTEGTPTETTATVLAVRGNTLALTEVTGEFGDAVSTSLAITRSADGRLAELWFFDAEDLGIALDQLQEAYFDTFERTPTSLRVSNRLRSAMEDNDRDAYRALLSDDLVATDHRSIGLGTRTADELVASLPEVDLVVVTRDHVEVGDLHVLSLGEFRADDGRSLVVMHTLISVDPASHLVTRIETFDQMDRDAARARFDEVAASPPSDDAAPPFTNEAFRIARRVDECFVRGDWSTARALVHDDAIGHSAMRFRTWDEFGPGDFVDSWRRLYDSEGAPTRSSCTLVAIRGESLCLEDNTVQFDDAVITALQLTRVVDGRVAECWFYERDDLHDALDELDRQWDAAGDTRFVEFHAVWRRGQVSGDRTAVGRLLSPEFRAFDERRLGLPPMSRDEYLATSVGPNPGTDVVIQQIYGVRNRAGLHRARVTSPGGATWEHFAAWCVDEHELLKKIHTFDLDDYAAARRRYEELAADSDGQPAAVLSNEAVVVARRVHELYTTARRTREQRDRDALLSIVHPGYRGHDATRLRLADEFDRDQFLAAWLDGFEWAGRPTRHVTEPVAIRGELLCLSRISLEYDKDHFERLLITRVEDGTVAESWWFEADALTDALDELDAQWVALGGHPAWAELSAQLRAANWSGDVALFERLTSADFVVDDLRKLGVGRMERSQYLATSFGRRVQYIQTDLIEVTDRVGLTRDRFVDRDGTEWHQLAVLSYESGLMLGVELFDPDDLDGARARFDELASVGTGNRTSDDAATHANVGEGEQAAAAPAPTSHEPTNDAVAVAGRAHALFGEMLAGDRDQESLLTLVHPTYRGHNETRLRLNEDFDGDEFLAQWVEQFAWTGPPTRHDFEPIAVRGSTLCLARLALEYGDDHLHRLFITRVEDGQVAEHWWFEPDALHDALDLLDELWAPDGMDPLHGLVASRYRRTFASGTADDFRAVVTDDYVFRDHRKLGLGVRGLDDYLATSGDFFGRGEMIITEVLNWSGPVVLLRATFRLLGDDQIADPQLLTVTVSRGDRLAVQEPFDPDDLDAARARFDELVAEHAGPPAPAPGRRPADVIAQRSSARWGELAREINQSLRDRDSLFAVRDRFHPDFVGRWASTLFAALDDADRDEFLEVTANVIDMGQRLELTISETRGDRLALGAYTIWTDDNVSERLMVMRLDDGLFREFVVFDRADADAALAELDRQWRAVSAVEVPDEPLRNLAVDLAMLTRRAIIDDEYDELRRWQTDGFAVRIERRANPYRSLDGDTYVAGIRSTARLGLRPTEWEPIEIRGQQLALVRCDMIAPDTGDVLGILALVHVDAQGRGLHTIEYEPEDIDIARRELDRRWAAMNEWT